MKKSSTKTLISIFNLLFIVIISSQNLYGFVNTIPTDKTNKSKLTEERKIQNTTSGKLKRKVNKLVNKLEKYKQKKQENKKGLGLLISGFIFLILGIILIASSAGAGILNGLLLLILGVPCLIAGIVLLIVYLSRKKD